MRVFSVILTALCLIATTGVSVASAHEDGWRRRHEWREHHWRGEYREPYHWTEPREVYVRPRVFYAPPPVYYAAPSVLNFGFGIGGDEDDEE